jgi:hypothetical protein
LIQITEIDLLQNKILVYLFTNTSKQLDEEQFMAVLTQIGPEIWKKFNLQQLETEILVRVKINK